MVVEKEFENQKLVGEDVAEIEYQPGKCGQRKYRVVILRKNISVQNGEKVLFDEVRYFFYITNRTDKAGQDRGFGQRAVRPGERD